LTGINEVIFDDMELESFSDHLLNEFAKSVEEDDGMERFKVIVSRLVWLRNDYYRGSLEVIGPVSQVDSRICNVDDVRKAYILF